MTKCVVGFLLAISTGGFVDVVAQPATAKTAEQQYKNIQMFRGLPATELEPTMAFISGSLGVRCSYCHANPFDKDDKPTKLAARKMIRMVMDLNKGTFNGDTAVTCFTCHRGKPRPVSVPIVGQNLWGPAAPKQSEPQLPTSDSVLEKYVQALGGAAAWQNITTRITRGSRIGADGVLVPEDVYQKSPNKLVTITSYPDNSFTNGFNGTTAWGYSSKGGEQPLPAEVLKQLKDEADFQKELNLKTHFATIKVGGQEKVNDRAAWVVVTTNQDGQPEKLFFDAETGLLVRRYIEAKTFLGRLPVQTDYDDYREVDGVKLPFLIHWSMPGRIWGRKITEIKHNLDIDDAKFELPKKQR